MRSRFTNETAEVNVAQKVFEADPAAKAFMGSPEAVWCFYHDFLFPHIKAEGLFVCSDNLEFVRPDSVTAKDTAWLLARMARSCDKMTPDGEDTSAATATTPANNNEVLVRQTHEIITLSFFNAVRA